jgi:hypothetical protein
MSYSAQLAEDICTTTDACSFTEIATNEGIEQANRAKSRF